MKLGTPAVASADTDRPENASLTPAPSEGPSGGLEQSVDNAPVYKRWYVWAGAAAVVAAVAIGVAVGVSNSKPRTLGESEICGGKCDACIGFMCSAGIVKF